MALYRQCTAERRAFGCCVIATKGICPTCRNFCSCPCRGEMEGNEARQNRRAWLTTPRRSTSGWARGRNPRRRVDIVRIWTRLRNREEELKPGQGACSLGGHDLEAFRKTFVLDADSVGMPTSS